MTVFIVTVLSILFFIILVPHPYFKTSPAKMYTEYGAKSISGILTGKVPGIIPKEQDRSKDQDGVEFVNQV